MRSEEEEGSDSEDFNDEIDIKEEEGNNTFRKHEWKKMTETKEKQTVLQKKDYDFRWVYTEREGAQVFKCILHHNCEFLLRISCEGTN